MSYPGSKAQAGIFQRIIGQMRPHSFYVEPFYGSGQVFKKKLAARESILIDLNAAAIAKADAGTGVNAIVGDALKILALIKPALPADTVIYCDPPYMLSTRQGRLYYVNEFSDDQHASLLALLQGFKCDVLISGYPSDLYSSQLQNWRCVRYQAMTRGGKRTECLWCNFPEPEELHDWRYAGKTFRERTGLKRLASRHVTKLEQMPPRKRGYVLNAIAQRQAERWAGSHTNGSSPGLTVKADVAISRAPVSAPALLEEIKPSEVLIKVAERKDSGEPSYSARAFIGDLRIWDSQQWAKPLHAMYEAQDWAQRQGKTIRFEQNYV